MSRFGRRSREVAPIADQEQAPAPAARDMGSYRVAVAHRDPEHPSATPAHWGPAVDSAFIGAVAQVRGVPVSQVDHLEAAQTLAERCRGEHDGDWNVWVERLVDRGGDSEWERVA